LHSAAHRGFTVVTILTLFFTPVLKGHHWKNVLTGSSTDVQIVECQPHGPCPHEKHETVKIVLPPQQP
jgi:hypothetical protein